MTTETAERYLNELSEKADVFAEATSGIADKLMYTLNCACISYNSASRGLLVNTPLNQQKCFTDFNLAFKAFTAAVKELVSGSGDDAGGSSQETPLFGYLFEMDEDEMKEELEDLLSKDGRHFTEAQGLCRFEMGLPHTYARTIVNLTVSRAFASDKEELTKYSVGLMEKMGIKEGRMRVSYFGQKADLFDEQIAPYEEKGLRYLITSVNATCDSKTGSINLLSIPAQQGSFTNFNDAFKLFASSIAASLAVIEFTSTVSYGKDGGAHGQSSPMKFTSVFDNPEESAANTFKEASSGKTVCLCTYMADQPLPTSRAYISIFACMPD